MAARSKPKVPSWIVSASDKALYKSFPKFLWLLWTKHLNLPKPTRVQYDMARYLQNGPRKRFIQAFRGVGKSWITCAYVCWRLWRNPQLRILIVSANEKKAAENAIFIKQLIDTVDILSPLRGGERDSVLNFDVGPAEPSPAPSVRCDGIFGQITGARADIILADDLEVPKNSETETMRSKLEMRSREFAMVAKPNTETIYLGTPQTEDSIYRALQGKGYDVRVWPGRYPTAETLKNYADMLSPMLMEDVQNDPSLMKPSGSTCGGAPCDPERFDELVLMEKECEVKVGPFMLQMMLDTRVSDAERYPLKLNDLIVLPLDNEIAPVKVAWAGGKDTLIDGLPNLGFDGDRYHKPMYISSDWIKYQGSVMFIDPSGRGTNETAYAVTKMLNGMVYLKTAGGLPGGYSTDTLKQLCEIARDNAVNEIWVESNWGDGMYLKLLEPVLKVIYPCSLEEYQVSGQKELRILDKLEPVVQGHRLVIDQALIERDAADDVPKHKRLMYQFTHITKERGSLKFDDRIDVLAEAVGFWTTYLDRDVNRTEEEHKEKLRDAELREFMRRCRKQMPDARKYATY